MNKRPGRWFFVAVAIVLGAGTWLALWRRDIQVEPPELFGRVWTTSETQPAVMLYVTREERSKSVRGVGTTGSWRSIAYDRYALNLRRADDGASLATLPLGDYKERHEGMAPQILGLVGEVVWLWREGLVAHTLPTLELRCDVARLQESSPTLAALLPLDPKGFKVLPSPQVLVMRGRDAQFYTLDAGSATITAITAESLPPTNNSTRAEDRFDYLVAPGQSRFVTHPYNLLEQRFFTRTGQWYALLSDSERADLANYSPSGRPHGDVARRLYRADYVMDGNHPRLDLPTVEAVGEARLLQSGFIIRRAAAIWDVPDPSSTLVLAKPLLGESEPWEVVRLARDGTIPWRTSTELADLGEMLDVGTHIVFIGQRVARGTGTGPAHDTRERIVWIDTPSGTRRTLFVATGEIEAPAAP